MKQFLFAVMAVLALSACDTGSSRNPWSISANQAAPAQAAPDTITPAQPAQTTQIPQVPPVPPSGIYTDQMQQAYVPPPEAPVMAPATPVKVALLVPLSGAQENLGQALLQAAQLALFDVGSDSFELIPRDTKGTEAGAREAAQSAVADGAQMVLGPIFSPEVKAARTVLSSHNINMVAFTTDWTQAGGNSYVLGFMPFSQLQRVALYAHTHNRNKIGIFAPNTEYGNSVASSYNAIAKQMALPEADIMRFPADGRDISTYIQDFAKRDYNAVLIPAGGEQARAISRQLSANGMGPDRVQRIGTGLWDDAALASEPSLEGGWFAAPAPEQRQDFETRYRSTYGGTPPRLATLAYDATALAAVLARNSSAFPGRPVFDRASLTNPNGFAGVDGVFRFRPDGLAERGLALLQFHNGRIETLDPAPRSFQTQLIKR